ncbi:MAG: recombination mediator RecR [Spirochaetia bacterium]|nr:recombination mediator RecR [Spirochaetia bacterium]
MIPELNELANLVSGFPGIGQKSATRIAFHLLKQSDRYINNLIDTIAKFHKNMQFCPECGALKNRELGCELCSDARDHSILCVVEQPSDAFTIEISGDYHGIYHVLMGCLSPLDGIGPNDIRLKELEARIRNKDIVKEIVVATNPSLEGNATANYIAEEFKNISGLKISRIAMGLAIGSQLEFSDSKIISQSIKNRTLILEGN